MKQAITASISFVLGIAAYYFYHHTPTIRFAETAPDIAHSMSANYRNEAGICSDTTTCTNYSGIFELGTSTISDMKLAMADIEAKLKESGTTQMPKNYRFFMGKDASKNTKLIMVALNDKNQEYDDKKYIRTLDGDIPCPLLCDLKTSQIFWGSSPSQNSCCK
jgi:hypothetical protein